MFKRHHSNSPVEIELLLEKITIKKIFDFYYTEFSEENKNYLCVAVPFGDKKLWGVFFIVFIFKGN